MVLYYRSMAKMAELLGECGEERKRKESELSVKIENELYDERQNVYVDRNRFTGEFSKVLSPASFMPLFVGTASPERAAAMNLFAKDAYKFYPGMPTVTYDCEGYDNHYWRG